MRNLFLSKQGFQSRVVHGTMAQTWVTFQIHSEPLERNNASPCWGSHQQGLQCHQGPTMGKTPKADQTQPSTFSA